MDDTTFGLDRQTYAKLSREDLESLAKQAAVAYLSSDGTVSLNDAIIKIARQHPSISSHQIRRVVEFANQETFSRMFEDNSKTASDKNIEFLVADPCAILQTLNMQAEPDVITLPDSDYHCGPVKTAAVLDAVEADIALAREFGFKVESPATKRTVMQKTAEAQVAGQYTDRILGTKVKEATPADRILAAGEDGVSGDTGSALTQDMVPDIGSTVPADEAAVKEGMGGPESMMMNAQPQQHPEVTHRENMRGMERRVELEKKKQELVAMQSKAVQTPGDMGGAPQPGMGQGQPPMGPPPGGPPPGGPSPGGPVQGAAPAPPPPQIKQGAALVDEALAYARMGRTKTAAVLDDLGQSVTIDTIKEAAQSRGQYPEANPHGNLIRVKQKLARVHEEAVVARDKNEFLMKEAEDHVLHTVTQHVLGGGNLGEVTHAMQSVPSNDNVIGSMLTKAAQHLVAKGLDPNKLRADMLPYEMSKSASVRKVNPDNPIVESFSAYCKMASVQLVLNRSAKDLGGKYDEVDQVLTQTLQHQHAQSA